MSWIANDQRASGQGQGNTRTLDVWKPKQGGRDTKWGNCMITDRLLNTFLPRLHHTPCTSLSPALPFLPLVVTSFVADTLSDDDHNVRRAVLLLFFRFFFYKGNPSVSDECPSCRSSTSSRSLLRRSEHSDHRFSAS